jgi:hypothetical protein
MKPQEMLENLTKQAEELRQDILQTEQSFIQKKEQFIRLQGAIEALNLVLQEEEAPTVAPTAPPQNIITPSKKGIIKINHSETNLFSRFSLKNLILANL